MRALLLTLAAMPCCAFATLLVLDLLVGRSERRRWPAGRVR